MPRDSGLGVRGNESTVRIGRRAAPKPDPVLMRILLDANDDAGTPTTRLQDRSPRIKRPIREDVDIAVVIVIQRRRADVVGCYRTVDTTRRQVG